MPKKTIEPTPTPLELTDTNEIPVVSVDVDTSYEAMLPDPVSASEHVGYGYTTPITVMPRKYENLLPVVSTVLASVVTGSLLIAVGIIIGAGL